MGQFLSKIGSKDTDASNENGIIAVDVESGRPQMQQIDSNTDVDRNDNDKDIPNTKPRCCPSNNNNNNNNNDDDAESQRFLDSQHENDSTNDSEIRELKATINDLKKAIKDKDTQIDDLKNDVKDWQDRLKTLSNESGMTSDDKYKKLLKENMALQQNLDEIYGGVPDSNGFPDIESIKKRFENTKKQSHTNVCICV